jgi:hypothetical protein
MIYLAGEFQEFFQEVLFGSGSWIGLILIISLLLIIATINRYSSIIVLPISILLSIQYMQNNLGWHAILIALVGIIIMMADIVRAKK